MPEGRVKWFSETRGYGFIEQEDGSDIFVHHSAVKIDGYRTLREGDRVSYNVGTGKKGPAAEDVRRLIS